VYALESQVDLERSVQHQNIHLLIFQELGGLIRLIPPLKNVNSAEMKKLKRKER